MYLVNTPAPADAACQESIKGKGKRRRKEKGKGKGRGKERGKLKGEMVQSDCDASVSQPVIYIREEQA